GPTTEKEITNYLNKILNTGLNVHLYISGPHVVLLKNKFHKKLSIFWSMDSLIEKFNLKG
ncbi:MAG TPA: hypothetical protein VJ909_01740, partial [Prolixibacteraceae bacterium]|nr:hypothetical protein [Prolixibacteraceae bacterium]